MTDTFAIILLLMLPVGLLGNAVGVWAARPTAVSPGWEWRWGLLGVPSVLVVLASASFLGFLIWALYTQLE